MPSGKLLLPWLVLLVPVHGKDLAGAEGAWSPVCSRGGGHQKAHTLPVSPKQVTHSRQACGNASSKLAWLCPSISCPAACQQGSWLQLPASRAGNVTGRPTGLGFGDGTSEEPSCGTVMDEATRDDIPGMFIPAHTSGKPL